MILASNLERTLYPNLVHSVDDSIFYIAVAFEAFRNVNALDLCKVYDLNPITYLEACLTPTFIVWFIVALS